MTSIVDQLVSMLATAGGGLTAPVSGGLPAGYTPPAAAMEVGGVPVAWAIPLLPILGVVLMLLCAVARVRSKLPAVLTVACLAAAFAVTLWMYLQHAPGAGPQVAQAFTWIGFSWGEGWGQRFIADFALYIDALTLLWMLFVTGLSAVIALYASEYMSHDVGPGYIRFFAAFNLFVASMALLVMGDNLLVMFLGWEGVGLCSYLLIGYFYRRPEAVAAAKKAFIVNRIGDLGLLLGILACFTVFGTVKYSEIFWFIQHNATPAGGALSDHWSVFVVPALLTCGAFGKSAQLFFFVWLPDAMEGPTPVSALIHAATMVTAGVYLIARMYPLYTADPSLTVLSFVAWAGAITAFWAAILEMAIFDIKRVMGYSTISQLGFMFAGLGVLSPVGASFHTFTHAFFKATLFLGVGAVMHGFGGQLDLRRMSGVMWMRGFGLVGVAMFIGSINLSGVPFTAGFFSKDIILADAFALPSGVIAGSAGVAWILLITAGMTAYYTFRTFFRVYTGPREFTPGTDQELLELGRHPKGTTLEEWHARQGHAHGHGHGHGHGPDHAGHAHPHGQAPAERPEPGSVEERRYLGAGTFDPETEEFDPHPPGTAMKSAITLCMVLAVAAAGLYFTGDKGGWASGMIADSSARVPPMVERLVAARAEQVGPGTFLGQDPHTVMYYVSALVGLIGILIAAYLHGPRGWQGLFIGNRERAEVSRADALIPLLGPLVPAARAKWYVDEIYNAILRVPLLVGAHLLHLIDKLLLDKLLVDGLGSTPRYTGEGLRESQSGVLNGYSVSMALGVGGLVILAVVLLA